MCVYLVHMNISLVYQKADHKGLYAMILLLQILLPLKTLSTEWWHSIHKYSKELLKVHDQHDILYYAIIYALPLSLI